MALIVGKVTASRAAAGAAVAGARAASTWWGGIQQAPEDPILGVSVAFQKDEDPRKINLGVGAYRDDAGKPVVLPSVREAEKRILAQEMNHEYLPITGDKAFCDASAKLAFGADNDRLQSGCVVSMQSLSGTGSVRVGAEFLFRQVGIKHALLTKPTWANHIPIFERSGMTVEMVPYYDPATKALDFGGYVAGLKNAPERSAVLLHACAHNPTGVDPTPEQWKEISAVIKAKGHFPFFDSAYQGFASGDTVRDAVAIRQFLADGHDICLAQSFAKNFGLYGERIGAFHIVTSDSGDAGRVLSQLKLVARPMYSNPPLYGARIVSTVLNDDTLHAQWNTEVKGMADRIIDMRSALVAGLEKAGSVHSWKHVTDQIGMFCFTGLTPEQVDDLAKNHHIYLTKNGRISIAGINSSNVQYLADCMHAVTK